MFVNRLFLEQFHKLILVYNAVFARYSVFVVSRSKLKINVVRILLGFKVPNVV